jgi:energy-coupling factor transport system substrate-specific component
VSVLRGRGEDLALLGITGAGLSAFILPAFTGRTFGQTTGLFCALIIASAIAILGIGLQTNHLSTRLLAVLAALVALDATLRLVVVIGLLGFSPIFFLIIVGGYVFGPGFGFALGALTLIVSAVITAGFGPWLPYQMLASGWVGMGAGYLGRLRTTRWRMLALAAFGCLAGWGYGLLLDLWEWPFLFGGGASPIGWAAGLTWAELGRRFGGFYLATSFVYDTFRAIGNLVLITTLGPAVMRALARFRSRFLVQWAAVEDSQTPAANIAGDVRTPA